MPVSIVRRHALAALAAAMVLILGALVVRLVLDAAPSAVAAPSTPPGAGPVARLDTTRVDLVTGGSEARYRAQEVLSGRGFNEAVGRTGGVQGAILLDAAGAVVAEQSKISVDLTSLQSDSNLRDNYIKRMTLRVGQFPTADFVVTAVSGLPLPLPTSGNAAFELVGDLTVHGVTRPTTWQATATFADGEVSGAATTTVLISDFGMEPPRAGPVLSIEDKVQLELDVRGTVAPSMAELLSDPS